MSSAGTGGGPFSPSRPGPVGGESGGGLAFANVLSSGRALISPAAQYGIRKSCQNSDLRRSVGWGMEVQEIHDILQKLPRPTPVRTSPEPELIADLRGLIGRSFRPRARLSGDCL